MRTAGAGGGWAVDPQRPQVAAGDGIRAQPLNPVAGLRTTVSVSSKLANFASILEDQTRAQAERTASMPFVFPHLALMPDAHLGKGATVGSVIPTLGAIMPAAVGVDIGCGMIAVRTQFTTDVAGRSDWPRCARRSSAAIPLSAGRDNAADDRHRRAADR